MAIIQLTKTDFEELLPTKISIARVYVQQVATLAHQEHSLTHEDVYNEIAIRHRDLFKTELPFASYDSFRKYVTKHRQEIYKY